MKATISATVTVALICVLLALPSTALATPPDSLTIDVDMYVTGSDSAAGTCWITGLFVDSGPCSELFFIADNTSHGVKTVVGQKGTITIRYQVVMTWLQDKGLAEGRWVVISGTGDYEKLHAVGDTHAELDLATGHLVAKYPGQAHID